MSNPMPMHMPDDRHLTLADLTALRLDLAAEVEMLRSRDPLSVYRLAAYPIPDIDPEIEAMICDAIDDMIRDERRRPLTLTDVESEPFSWE